MRKKIKLIQNLYSVDIDDVGSYLYIEAIELQNNEVLKTDFREMIFLCS